MMILKLSQDQVLALCRCGIPQQLQQLHGHTEMVNSVAFSHDGIHIGSGSHDKSKNSFISQTWIKHFSSIPSFTHVRGRITMPLMTIHTDDFIE
jgi:WD40 repeat protein